MCGKMEETEWQPLSKVELMSSPQRVECAEGGNGNGANSQGRDTGRGQNSKLEAQSSKLECDAGSRGDI